MQIACAPAASANDSAPLPSVSADYTLSAPKDGLRSVGGLHLAQTTEAVSGAAAPVKGVAAAAPLPESESSDPAASAKPAGPRNWFGWGLPPIRWGGQLISDVRGEKTEGQPRRISLTDISNIKASSYLWQPWFATIGGGLGLVNGREFRSPSDQLPANQPRNTASRAVTGNADLTLFPVSRFPFNAYFDLSDSRVNGDPSTSEFSNMRFGLRQNYRPLEGNTNISASFNHSTLESASFGKDSVNAFAGSYNTTVGPQIIDLSGSHTNNSRSNTGERTAFTNLVARHGYRPEPQRSVESLASFSNSDFRLLSGGVPAENRSRFAQLNTFATWRPDDESPWFFTGGARVFQSAIASNQSETTSNTLSSNVAATYALNRQTRISAGATVSQVNSDVSSNLVTTQNASLSYVGDPRRIYDFSYSWNANANAANQTGLVEGSRQNAGASVGHNALRSIVLNPYSQVSFNVGQNLFTNYDTLLAQSHTLTHNGSVSWRISRDAATTAYVSLLASDSRTSGALENHFQMLNLQVSGQWQFSRSSVAAANLTSQGVRQTTPTTPDAPANFNTTGSLSYTHLRAFDIPRLRYSAVYTVNDSQYRSRLQGDVNAPRERINQSFEQRFDYAVGRVGLRLTARIAEIEGRRDALLFFRLAREFGGY